MRRKELFSLFFIFHVKCNKIWNYVATEFYEAIKSIVQLFSESRMAPIKNDMHI